MEKEWKIIDGVTNKYGHVYAISNHGEVLNVNTNKLLSNRNKYNEYARASIGQKEYRVHILVAEAFVPNPENKPIVNHIDGIKSNNVATNLEWATLSENMFHAYQNNLKKAPIGELNARSVLNKDDVFDIWLNFYSTEEIHKKYKITEGSARNLLHRKTWTHLIDEFDSKYEGVYEANLKKYKILNMFASKDKSLPDSDILDIYIKANDGYVLAQLARDYGISESTVHAIKNKKTNYIKRILLERGMLDEIN